MDSILTKGKVALETQKVTINKATFEDVMDATHTAFKVSKAISVMPISGIDLFVRLKDLDPEPFEGWRAIMSQSMERISRLTPGASELDVAEAYGALSNTAVEEFAEIGRRLGDRPMMLLKSLLAQGPRQIVESLRTYLLVPFQRLLVGFKVQSLRVQKSYELSTGTQDDLHQALEKHLEYLGPLMARTQGFTRAKLTQGRNRLAMILPILRDEVRAAFLPGGQFGLPYLVNALILGVLSEIINPNRVPVGSSDTASIDVGARAPIQIMDACLNRLQLEGLTYSEQEIRDLIARRAEAEKVSIIAKMHKMTPEEKRGELMKKRLGLGDWAVGGTKAIYAYDPEQYERERAQRATMELGEFGGAAATPAATADDFGGGGAGAEGGYDNDQMAAEDY